MYLESNHIIETRDYLYNYLQISLEIIYSHNPPKFFEYSSTLSQKMS